MSIMNLVLLYAAELWADMLKVSKLAILIVVGVISTDLLAQEGKNMFNRRTNTKRLQAQRR